MQQITAVKFRFHSAAHSWLQQLAPPTPLASRTSRTRRSILRRRGGRRVSLAADQRTPYHGPSLLRRRTLRAKRDSGRNSGIELLPGGGDASAHTNPAWSIDPDPEAEERARREAADYHGGTVRAIFLDRTFPTGQVVQVGLKSRARTVRVDINGTWHEVTTLAC